jgi:hypothetical protein
MTSEVHWLEIDRRTLFVLVPDGRNPDKSSGPRFWPLLTTDDGQIAERFDCAKPTLSAPFRGFLRGGLARVEKVGTSITYSLKFSVL